LKQPNALQRNWKSLYFILHEINLYYFTDEQAVESSGVLMLSQMSGAFVEVKSRSCFALHNEITGKNFVISAESSPILQEWITLIQPMLMSHQQKNEAITTDKVIWGVNSEAVSLNHPREYEMPLHPGKYSFELEKADWIVGPTRLVSAIVTLKHMEHVVSILKTGKVGNVLRYTPEEFVVAEEGRILNIQVRTTALAGSVKFNARVVKKSESDLSPETKINST